MRLSSYQLKAARGLLDLTVAEFASLAGVSRDTIADWEAGRASPQASTIEAAFAVLDARGVELIGARGVALREEGIRRFGGARALYDFFDDVYTTVMHGGTVCVTGVDETMFDKHYNPTEQTHSERMIGLGDKLAMRCILREGDTNFTYSGYITYRWMARDKFDPSPMYVYNHKLAMIDFSKDAPDIVVFDAPAMAHAFRKQFDFIWQHCKEPPQRKR